MKRLIIILLSIVLTLNLSMVNAGGNADNKLKGVLLKATIVNGDTVPMVNLKEAVIIEKMIFESEEDAKKYRLLVRDVRRVYPYAILLNAKIKEYNHAMEGMNKQAKRAFIKKAEPELKAQFEKAFRNNTVNQAQLLIKLIDRESGSSSHHLIQQYKGKWNAFVWQSVALMVGTNLKAGYDPKGEDKVIERIVRSIESGII